LLLIDLFNNAAKEARAAVRLCERISELLRAAK
jgi:hypothetical protein